MFDKAFFCGKKICVTGHTGFKGTWLLGMLEQLKSDVYGYALEGSNQTEFYNKVNPRVVGETFGYIQDKQRVIKWMQQASPDIVIHLASHSTLNKGDEITHYIYESNVMGVVNVLEAVRQTPSVEAVLIVTSDKCYENQEKDIKYDETSKLGAQDPYSTSKACQELITESYRKSFFSGERKVTVCTARASNVIGGGDNNLTRLFPYLLYCFSNGIVAEIRKPTAIRPWQNVLDVLGGYLTLVQKMYEGALASAVHAFNFGPEDDGFVTVKEVADLLCCEFPDSQYRIIANTENVIETNILKLDNSLSKEVLDWFPNYSFRDTIHMSAEFYKNLELKKMRENTMSFISEYLNDIRYGE